MSGSVDSVGWSDASLGAAEAASGASAPGRDNLWRRQRSQDASYGWRSVETTGANKWTTRARTASQVEHVWREWITSRGVSGQWRRSALPSWCKTCQDLFGNDEDKEVGNIIRRTDNQYDLYMREGYLTMEDFESQLEHHPLEVINKCAFASIIGKCVVLDSLWRQAKTTAPNCLHALGVKHMCYAP